LLYSRTESPLGKTWEEWAAIWCNWLLSIPKHEHPNFDLTGHNCYKNQQYDGVWFLGGTFGNIEPIHRHCKIPGGRSILFSILEKEDSFAEDTDLINESQLRDRASNFIDNVINIEASIDNLQIKNLHEYRVRSEYFHLTFPEDPVYDVEPGVTRAVSDGYWIFTKALTIGKHEIHFKAKVDLRSDDEVVKQMKNDTTYLPIKDHIEEHNVFELNVNYHITIV
jgi:hypothetical protein